MNPTRKQITLPSGGVCSVRKFSMFDLRSLPEIPAALTEPKEPKADAKADAKETVDRGTVMARVALLRCCSPILTADGQRLRIVEKEFFDCGDGEISADEVETADALTIVNAVSELSGLGKEAASAAAPFPEKPAAPAES